MKDQNVPSVPQVVKQLCQKAITTADPVSNAPRSDEKVLDDLGEAQRDVEIAAELLAVFRRAWIRSQPPW